MNEWEAVDKALERDAGRRRGGPGVERVGGFGAGLFWDTFVRIFLDA